MELKKALKIIIELWLPNESKHKSITSDYTNVKLVIKQKNTQAVLFSLN